MANRIIVQIPNKSEVTIKEYSDDDLIAMADEVNQYLVNRGEEPVSKPPKSPESSIIINDRELYFTRAIDFLGKDLNSLHTFSSPEALIAWIKSYHKADGYRNEEVLIAIGNFQGEHQFGMDC